MHAISLLVKESLSWLIKVVTTLRNIELENPSNTSWIVIIENGFLHRSNFFQYVFLKDGYCQFPLFKRWLPRNIAKS